MSSRKGRLFSIFRAGLSRFRAGLGPHSVGYADSLLNAAGGRGCQLDRGRRPPAAAGHLAGGFHAVLTVDSAASIGPLAAAAGGRRRAAAITSPGGRCPPSDGVAAATGGRLWFGRFLRSADSKSLPRAYRLATILRSIAPRGWGSWGKGARPPAPPARPAGPGRPQGRRPRSRPPCCVASSEDASRTLLIACKLCFFKELYPKGHKGRIVPSNVSRSEGYTCSPK